MKKILVIFVLLFFIVSCSNNQAIGLNEQDFSFKYKSLTIDSNTDVNYIQDKIGYGIGYESNNAGFISGNKIVRRWRMDYNDFEVICLESGEKFQYVVGAFLYKLPTKRGLKVGDKLENVKKLYGNPNNLEGNRWIYDYNEMKIEIEIENKEVTRIFLNFRMEKSIKDQKEVEDLF